MLLYETIFQSTPLAMGERALTYGQSRLKRIVEGLKSRAYSIVFCLEVALCFFGDVPLFVVSMRRCALVMFRCFLPRMCTTSRMCASVFCLFEAEVTEALLSRGEATRQHVMARYRSLVGSRWDQRNVGMHKHMLRKSRSIPYFY